MKEERKKHLINLGLWTWSWVATLANRKLFNHYDELERKIHLESLALTLGLTVIVGLSYSLLDLTNLIPFDAEIGILVGFVGVTYMTTLLINRKRYL